MIDSRNALGCIVGGIIGDTLAEMMNSVSKEDILHTITNNRLEMKYLLQSSEQKPYGFATQMMLFTVEGLLWAKQQEQNERRCNLASRCFYSYQRFFYTQGKVLEDTAYAWVLDDKRLEIRSPLLTMEGSYLQHKGDSVCLEALRHSTNQDYGTIQSPINQSNGVGGLVRVAPVAVAYADSKRQAFQYAAEIAAITHGNPTAYLAAGTLTSILTGLIEGIPLEKAVSQSISILSRFAGGEEVADAVKLALTLAKEKKEHAAAIRCFSGADNAAAALGAGLYATLCYPEDLGLALSLLVNYLEKEEWQAPCLVCGHLSGAKNGYTASMEALFSCISDHKILYTMITRLIKEYDLEHMEIQERK